ncbi:MAG: hypothetical protein H6867_01990 [Rhodospirillales bacterium]|nr:hypothetical protein [Rhodospirillales bacterium]MCB9996958.1 hypothetical protein [Rhodospirillales bacterium]
MAWAAGPIAPAKGPGVCGGALTIGGVIQCVVENSQESIGLLTALSYLFGLVIGAMAVIKVIEHVTNPHQVSAWEPMKRALVAGCLFALPMVTEALYNTLVDGGALGGINDNTWSGAPTGGGLDAMVVALMNNAFAPMHRLVALFCYLAGVVLAIVGIMRLLKSAQEGARGPGGFGTIMTFLIAGVLFSADEMMAAWENTLFGTQTMNTKASLNFAAGLTAVEEQHILSVISAVVAFVMVLGWISFIRGWFIVRDVAEGNSQASMMAAITHIFGGALAINLGGVMNAVQETFGLAAIGVNFN